MAAWHLLNPPTSELVEAPIQSGGRTDPSLIGHTEITRFVAIHWNIRNLSLCNADKILEKTQPQTEQRCGSGDKPSVCL